MFGMDPVLSGSLCFLILAIIMYVKFIREQPWNNEDAMNHRSRHKNNAVDPDIVPFLHPTSPTGIPQQQQHVAAPHHPGHRLLQKAQMKKLQSTHQQHYHNYLQPKQPMRRRTHSAATNPNFHPMNPHSTASNMGPNDMSLSIAVDHHGSGMYESNYGQSSSNSVTSDMYASSSNHHEINFEDYVSGGGGIQNNVNDMGENAYYNQDRSYASPIRTIPFEDKQVQYPPLNGPLSPPPAPFLIGGMHQQQHHHQQHHADIQDVAEQFIPQPKVTTNKPFNKDSVPQPAQMQLEIARKAHIPLFLHSPMYVRTSINRLLEIQSQQEEHLREEHLQQYQQYEHQQAANEGDQYNNNGAAMTPRKSQKLPPRYQNNSLHIDFAELKLQEMIGQGAFGTVHRATWRGTTVAVKILVCQTLTPDVLEEFETEVQIMSILRHPNICLLMGACLNPPTRCLVVEYLPKGSLWNVLRQDVVMDHVKQMSFTKDTALGMNYLHSFQPPILHRDLKSPNLLVDSSYAIKISDFGLARVRAHFQTMTGNCGTTQWMAPEVLAAEKYTEKADVFSFGVVVWEIITRACPYEGLCQIQAALGVLNNNLRPAIPSNCPPMFKKLMTLCWANVPEQRPTFEAILEILNSVEQGHVVTNRQMEDLADPSTQV